MYLQRISVRKGIADLFTEHKICVVHRIKADRLQLCGIGQAVCAENAFVSIAEYAEYVLDLKERTGTKTRTIERYRALLERVNGAIGHIKLTDIRPQHLNAFYQNLGEEGIRGGGAVALARIDLQEWMERNGMSSAKLASKAGISSATLSAAMHGRRSSE